MVIYAEGTGQISEGLSQMTRVTIPSWIQRGNVYGMKSVYLMGCSSTADIVCKTTRKFCKVVFAGVLLNAGNVNRILVLSPKDRTIELMILTTSLASFKRSVGWNNTHASDYFS